MPPSSINRTIDGGDIISVKVSETGLVVDRPCWLFGFNANSTFVVPRSLYLRDGLDVAGVPKYFLFILVWTERRCHFNRPVRFEAGLFCEIDGPLSVFIRYLPDY